MSVPYEMPPSSGLRVPAGGVGCFVLDFPSRSVISKIVIEQTAGAPVAFVATLYNHENACEGSAGSDSAGPTTGAIPPRLYKVSPDLASTGAGYLEYFSDEATGGHGLVFVNQDKTPTGRQMGNPRKLYLRIAPVAASDTEFAVAIAGEIYE